MVRGHLAAFLPVDDGEAADAPARFAAEIDVLVDRHVPGEGKVLIDHLYADRTGVAWAVEADGSSLEKELAGARRVEPGEDLHQRRLAGAVVADDAEHFAALQLQADGIERGDRAEILRYPLCFEERSAGMVNRRRFHGAPLPWFA